MGLVVLIPATAALVFELKLNPDEIDETVVAGKETVVEVLVGPLPKLNIGAVDVVFVSSAFDSSESTVFVSACLLVSPATVDIVVLVLLNVEELLWRLKVTRFGVADFISVSLFKIGTMVVVIGDVFTVVVDVKEFNDT